MVAGIDNPKLVKKIFGQGVLNRLKKLDDPDISEEDMKKEKKAVLEDIFNQERDMIRTQLIKTGQLKEKIAEWKGMIVKYGNNPMYDVTEVRDSLNEGRRLLKDIEKTLADFGEGLISFLTDYQTVASLEDLSKLLDVDLGVLEKHAEDYQKESNLFVYLIYRCQVEKECKGEFPENSPFYQAINQKIALDYKHTPLNEVVEDVVHCSTQGR